MSPNGWMQSDSSRRETLFLIACVAVAAVLRLWNLGELGIRDDEDITKLAIQSVLQHGYPLMPSEMIYLRSTWFLWVQSAFGWFFGATDGWLRLPAVLFSVATVPLAYLFTRRIFSKEIALGVAALLAISYTEVEMARMVRMYAPFAFMYLLSVAAIYRRYVDGSSDSTVLPLVLACLTFLTHLLGFTLALIFLLPLVVVPTMSWKDRACAFGSGVIVGVGFLVWEKAIGFFMSRASRLNGISIAEPDAASDASTGLVALILSYLEATALPRPDYFLELVANGPLLVLGLGIAITALVGLIIGFGQMGRSKLELGVAALLFVACLLHQINSAAILFLAYILVARRGLEPLRQSDGITLAAAIVVSFLSWLTYAYLYAEPNEVAAAGISTHFRQSVRFLLDFPQYSVIWGYAFARPLASLSALIGMLWCIEGAAQPKPDRQKLFLLLVFFVPLIVTGLFESTYRNFRYILHLDVFFMSFVVLGLFKWREVLSALGWPAHINLQNSFAKAVTIVLGVVTISYALNPLRSVLAVERNYGEPTGAAAVLGVPFYPDFRTTAEFVSENRSSGDSLILLQSREYYSYLGEGAYWLTSNTFEHENQTYVGTDGIRRDAYVDMPVLTSRQELFSVIRDTSGFSWLVAPDHLVQSRETLTDDLADYIDGLDDYLIYTGRDQDMKVYRIPPDSIP